MLKNDRPQFYVLVEKPPQSRRRIMPVVWGVLLALMLILSVIALWDSLTGYSF